MSDWLDAHTDCKLVVIDTLQKIKPISRKNHGNAYEADYQALGGLQQLALAKNTCILLTHHNRKSDDKDALMTVSGSVGITGTCDTILLLTRARGGTESLLTVTGRDINEHTIRMLFDGSTGEWTVSGGANPIEANLGDTATQIMKFMHNHTGQWFYCKDLLAAMGLSIGVDSFRKNLHRLRDKGLLEQKADRFGIPEELPF